MAFQLDTQLASLSVTLFMQTMNSILVSAFTLWGGYHIWRRQATNTNKTAACREAYQKFYLPFISMLFRFQVFDCGFSHTESESREKLFLFIMDNIQYMEKEEIDHIDALCGHYRYIKRTEEKNEEPIILTHERLDELFDSFTKSVLLRAEQLAHILNQPVIGKFVLDLYLGNREAEEIRKEEVAQHLGQMLK
ncbi:hypothetical protein [Ruthenibacterium lactatiformans]|uniref:hypothetical protein n=1 Tax=Ruthenibacterium lactatiformans TaxID=1550024 RepID=UPI0026756846|nr:hypothetical protein [Ruthenibacterium lactatiformans]